MGSALILVLANKQDLPNAMSVACVTKSAASYSLPVACRSNLLKTGVCSGRECTDKLGLHALRERKWFIQATCAVTGEGIVGEKAGTQLEFLPTALVRWADFKSEHPAGEVLSPASAAGARRGLLLCWASGMLDLSETQPPLPIVQGSASP